MEKKWLDVNLLFYVQFLYIHNYTETFTILCPLLCIGYNKQFLHTSCEQNLSEHVFESKKRLNVGVKKTINHPQ